MPAELIDGAAIARTIREEVARDVASLSARGLQPGLAVVLVGDDPASTVYVRNKDKACTAAGMHGVTVRLPATISQEELLAQVDALNANPAIHGFLVQMPLPKHLDADAVIRRIDPKKDVDGFHPVNVGKMLIGDTDGFVPATPAGVRELLVRSGVQTDGLHCVIIGRSNIVGKPMAALMVQNQPGANATVTVCHSRTKSLPDFTKRADILIVAAGKANMLRGDMIKPGAVVIDVGINRVDDASAPKGHRLVGDVDFDSVREVASKLTPVPGGVGPMTIAMLLRNTVRAAERELS
ncbi:MAG: bifunctional methylenetetrahydrofolate dehydrogenase/methenyltetrahydrofolate cyclohydrolase FolD [Gemmatimonadaceae bacterium]|nr:bifunctional methylenetetrahydrofolate dehydrogenase/methenyltetrahydrofolate cyclohydrolase FolD [Gemmatimonadaceae bacterium]MDQ3518846.1 bifunctional methylenetetrahydrofolate dehydrogenase/methenyltetrahydrofolate cyclohydrolase FolD [Gemmatimonadota bacterium]